MKNSLVIFSTILLSLSAHATTYYVDASRPDDAGNGQSWGTAKKTIQAAVDITVSNDLVLVTNGVYNTGTRVNSGYSLQNRVVITNEIMVKSVNGPLVTIIEGSGTNFYNTASAIRCAYMSAGILDGFTLEKGATFEALGSSWDQVGGGVSCVPGVGRHAALNNCILRGNKALNGGGGDSITLFENCLITGNTADSGGAGFGIGTFINCTITKNSAVRGGGSWGAKLDNCIIWDNSGGNYQPTDTIQYSCATPLPTGSGNINADPLFIDAANGDFRLQTNSPCINVGSNGLVRSETDLVGNYRISAKIVDMGAYEFQHVPDQITRLYNLPLESVSLCGTTLGTGLVVSNNTVTIKGSVLGDDASSGFTFSFQNQGRLTFRWSVSSEYYYDTMSFYVDDVLTNQISGKKVTWASITNMVTASGPHTFKWEYAKDVDTSVGQDSAWVTNLVWAPRSSLTVENGSGAGAYFMGDTVSISAATAPTHYTFDRWTGYTKGVADVFASSTTLMMPATDTTVTATYKPILYTLSVADGSGSGSYPSGSSVEIGATPYEGKRFYRWTGDVDTVANVWSATTTVQTADHTLAVGVKYSFQLTVNAGSGGGWYLAGTNVDVAAGSDPLYKEFSCWTGDASGLLVNAAARVTSLTMPPNAATLTAFYADSISRVLGSYGRSYVLSGTAGGIYADADAESPSVTPAVKLGGLGVVPDNGFAAFETVVWGSGDISFQWKVSSEGGADYLNFLVDSNLVYSIDGTGGTWAKVSHHVAGPDVNHVLRWEYKKNASVNSGFDAGWVDDIIWTGDVPVPALTPVIVQAALTNQNMVIQFTGERGIPYLVQTNGTLNLLEWSADQSPEPTWINESNGVHRFEIISPASAPDKLFYRISTGAFNTAHYN
ncbi:MAG: choice-of-anchor Q domain-containing protein [bacterium]